MKLRSTSTKGFFYNVGKGEGGERGETMHVANKIWGLFKFQGETFSPQILL